VDEFAPHHGILGILRLFDIPSNGISETGWPSAKRRRAQSERCGGWGYRYWGVCSLTALRMNLHGRCMHRMINPHCAHHCRPYLGDTDEVVCESGDVRFARR
jgi:hypothetical protein